MVRNTEGKGSNHEYKKVVNNYKDFFLNLNNYVCTVAISKVFWHFQHKHIQQQYWLIFFNEWCTSYVKIIDFAECLF